MADANLRLASGGKLQIAKTTRSLVATQNGYRVVTDAKLSLAILANPDRRGTTTGFLVSGSDWNAAWAGKVLLLTAGHNLLRNPNDNTEWTEQSFTPEAFTASFPGLKNNQSVRLRKILFFSKEFDAALVDIESALPHGAIAIDRIRNANIVEDLPGVRCDVEGGREAAPSANETNEGRALATLGWTGNDGFIIGFRQLLEVCGRILRYTHVRRDGASGSPVFDANTGGIVCLHQRYLDANRGQCTALVSIRAESRKTR